MKYIWLSHQLTNDTPLFGGAKDFKIIREKSIANGDSCNTSGMILPSHTGTHVDAPRHFIKNGKCIDDYSPEDWLFKSIQIINVKIEPGQIIFPKDICVDENFETELIIFRTLFEQFRDQALFWMENPGLAPDLADYLIECCPNLKVIGMDFISISSYLHRNIGREAHKAFLSKNIRLIEDMHLSHLKMGESLSQLMVMPLRFLSADGTPCTVLGVVE